MCDSHVACGRAPILTDAGRLHAPVKFGAEEKAAEDWSCKLDVGSEAGPSGWTAGLSAQAAIEWLRQGQEEHASIASFSRFSLDLLRFAAPPELIIAAHLAAADEVRHAQRSFSLASHFNGASASTITVEAFPVATVELSGSLEQLAERVLQEGCIGESSAAARLALALDAASEKAPVYTTLKELLVDEAKHAALAWATLRWASRKGGVKQKSLAFRNEDMASFMNFEVEQWPLLLSWAGRGSEDIVGKAAALVRHFWVAPWVAAIASGEGPMPEVTIPGDSPLVKAVVEAAGLVQGYLEAELSLVV